MAAKQRSPNAELACLQSTHFTYWKHLENQVTKSMAMHIQDYWAPRRKTRKGHHSSPKNLLCDILEVANQDWSYIFARVLKRRSGLCQCCGRKMKCTCFFCLYWIVRERTEIGKWRETGEAVGLIQTLAATLQPCGMWLPAHPLSKTETLKCTFLIVVDILPQKETLSGNGQYSSTSSHTVFTDWDHDLNWDGTDVLF